LWIRRTILETDVLIAVIGRNWLEGNEEGQRRIDSLDDFVRLEIATALENNKRVIPVLVEGASFPRREQLPENITPLAYQQAIELTPNLWERDTSRLVKSILEADIIADDDEANGVKRLGLSGEFRIVFDPGMTIEQITGTLTALANYFRECGGVGLPADLEMERAEVLEDVHA